MKFKKFIEIKNYFYHTVSKKEYEMNIFLDSFSLNLVIDYLQEGYVLNNKQEQKLKQTLLANILYESSMENLLQDGLPDKYIYFLLSEKFSQIFKNKDKLNNLPNVKQWLLKQTEKNVAKSLVKNWMDNFDFYEKEKINSEIDKKINHLKDLSDYIMLLNDEDKKELVGFINNKAQKFSHRIFNKNVSENQEKLENLALYIEKIKNVSVDKYNNFSEIVKTLNEQKEDNVLYLLEATIQQYHAIMPELKDMDKIKRNAIMDLYGKHLLSSLGQYIEIKPQLRTKIINNKSAEKLILENITEVKNILDIQVQQLHEQKLMTLSAKSEYLSQLKKQW